MRTFHTGGVAEKGSVQSNIKTDIAGSVKYKGIRFIENQDGGKLVVSQTARIEIENHEFEIPSGSTLLVNEGDIVVKGGVLAEFDPYHVPIISEANGVVEYRELYPKEIVDKKFGVIERLAVKPMEHGDINPRVIIFSKAENGERLAEYNIPFGAYLMVKDGGKVKKGDIIAKIMKTGEGTKDITGGLPRVQELFEARTPKIKAMISEIDIVTGKQIGRAHV